jgi:hypothetical protein
MFFKTHASYEVMWKNTVKLDRPHLMTIIWRMHFTLWITKAVDTHSELLIQAGLILH